MSEEFIRKSDVLELLSDKGDDYSINEYQEGWNSAVKSMVKTVEKMPPVNAVELPCKVGDTVYFLKTLTDGKDTVVIGNDVVNRISINSCDVFVFISYDHCLLGCNFGKTVFLTRDEAERALEELKNE